MKKAISALAVLSVCLFSSLAFIFSHTASQFLWQQTLRHLPQLQGELTQGDLGKGWSIENVVWQSADFSFQAEKISLNWRLSQLLHKQLWITQLNMVNPMVLIPETDEPSGNAVVSASDHSEDTFSPPVSIIVEQIDIKNFLYTQPGLKVGFSHFYSSLRLNDRGLSVGDSTIKGLTTTTVQNDGQAQVSQMDSDSVPLVMPAVEFPFAFTVQDLQLLDTTIDTTTISHLSIAVSGVQDKLTITSLSAELDQVGVQGAGLITLNNHYPLAINIDLVLKEGALDHLPAGQKVSAELTGSLAKTDVQVTASGSLAATMQGSVAPLQPALPFSLNINWQPLQWPLAGSPALVHIQQGEASVTGQLSHYDFDLKTEVAYKDSSRVALAVQGYGNTTQMTLATAQVSHQQSAVKLQGTLDWSDDIDWQGELALEAFDPSLFHAQLPGAINGIVKHRFDATDKGWAFAIADIAVDGSLRKTPIAIEGKLNGNSDQYWRIDNTVFIMGENRLHVDGTLDEAWNMKATVSAPELSHVVPDLSGAAEGAVHLSGHRETPSVVYKLASPALLWQQQQLSGLTSSGSIIKGKEYEGEVQLQVKQANIRGAVLSNVGINAAGSESTHRLTIKSNGSPVSINLDFTGSWVNQIWQGRLSNGELGGKLGQWHLQQPVSLHVDTNKTLSMSKQCWLSKQSSLCIEPSVIAQNDVRLAFNLASLSLDQLDPFFPKNFSWQSELSGYGQLHWHNQQPEVALQLQTTPGLLRFNGVEHSYSDLNLDLKLNNEKLVSQFRFRSEQGLGEINSDITLTNIQQQPEIMGEVGIREVRLDILAPFIPELRSITGQLSAKGKLGGTLEKPLFYGNIDLAGGAFEESQQIAKVSDLNTRIQVDGSSAAILGTMLVGRGGLNLDGSIDWENDNPVGVVNIIGDDLDVQYPEMGLFKVNPYLRLTLGEKPKITGEITVPHARIDINQLPAHAVTPSGDVVVTTDPLPQKQTKSSPIDIDVHLKVGSDVKMEAFGLKTALHGELKITSAQPKPTEIKGIITLTEGEYRSFGQDLTINKGSIIFSGPADNPYLMLRAIRNPDTIANNVTAGVMVNGPVIKPDIQLFSEPAMSQNEQLSYLLRGKPVAANSGDGNAIQSALIGVGVSQLNGVVATIGRVVGLSDLNLDTSGSGDNTQVTISGHLAPKLEAQYGVGVFNSVNEITLKYEIMPQLYLQAVSGLVQALDIFYHFSM